MKETPCFWGACRGVATCAACHLSYNLLTETKPECPRTPKALVSLPVGPEQHAQLARETAAIHNSLATSIRVWEEFGFSRNGIRVAFLSFLVRRCKRAGFSKDEVAAALDEVWNESDPILTG